MSRATITPSLLESIDRQIEDAVGRIMRGDARPGDHCLVGDLTAQRAALGKPAAFERIERMLSRSVREPVGAGSTDPAKPPTREPRSIR